MLWQPKIEAQKHEIGTPMKTCPIIKEIFFFQTFYTMAILFFLLFILWQPKIKAQKYEIGTPMKTCP